MSKNIWESYQFANGELFPWTLRSPDYPTKLLFHTGAIVDNVVYVFGGDIDSGQKTRAIYRSTIGTDNKLTTWEFAGDLPLALDAGSVVYSNGRFYFTGGRANGMIQNKVYVGTLNQNSQIQWVETAPLSIPIYNHMSFTVGNKIYVVGGADSVNQIQRKVYQAEIQSTNGILSSWVEITDFPISLSRGQVFLTQNQVIIVGGYGIDIGHSSPKTLDLIYSAPITNSGNIGEWSRSETKLPQPICCAAGAKMGNYLYIIGGFNGSAYLTTVYSSLLETPTPTPTPTSTPTPTPSPTPTLTPTPTSIPTPTPTPVTPNKTLGIDMLKQHDAIWGNLTYDHADQWATEKTIARWGCALTSATMVLRYYGYDRLRTSGTTFVLDPGTLNWWLKTQKDGYVHTGWLNWQAIARFSREMKSLNNISTFDALEWRSGAYSFEKISGDILERNLPSILEVPGHFIVASGVLGNTFRIADPFYSHTLLSDAYNGKVRRIAAQYVPSRTDLSYILITAPPSVTITVKDKQDKTVASSEIQQPIIDPISGAPAGEPVSILSIPKPSDGTYTIHASSERASLSDVTVWTYDVNADVTEHKATLPVGNSSTQIANISYTKNASSSSKLIIQSSFGTLQALIDIYRTQGKIRRPADTMLQPLIKIGIRFSRNLQTSVRLIQNSLTLSYRLKMIDKDAYDVLMSETRKIK